MSILIDTHALVWWLLEPDRLSDRARRCVEEADQAFVSAVSIYEIDFKRQDNRIRGDDGLLRRMPQNMPGSLALLGLTVIGVSPIEAWTAARLPLHHGDPWDRILAAQAIERDIGLVTKDVKLARYEVEIVW